MTTKQINSFTPLEAALFYASKGWHVFARPGKSAYKDTHGQNDATTDTEIIKTMFEEHPDANVGIKTGRESNLIVLDVDNEKSMVKLMDDFSDVWPVENVYDEGRKGHYHFYFKYPGFKVAAPKSFREKYPEVEVKSDGGAVNIPSGNNRRWIDFGEPPDMPKALLDMLQVNGETKTEEEQAVGTVEEGHRNTALTRMAGFYHNLGLSPEELYNRLLQDNRKHCKPPLEESEVRSIAQWVRGQSHGWNFHLTELGTAEMFVWLHSDDVKYCDTKKCWYFWNGIYWVEDDVKAVQEIMKRLVKQMGRAARVIEDKETRKKAVNWARQCEGRFRIKNILELASSSPEIAVKKEHFDKDIWLLNCYNGTIDLLKGELREHRREDMITKVIPLDYDPSANDPVWNMVLDQFVGEDEELRRYFQKAIGYSVTGCNDEKVQFLADGPTDTGKTTIFEAIRTTLGDYAMSSSFGTFLDKRLQSGATPEIARMHGHRICIAEELNKKRKLNTGLLKKLTGGNTITARFLYERKEWEFKSVPKIWLVGNTTPDTDYEDDAIWNRMRRIPFRHRIKKVDDRIKIYLTDITKAGTAVLGWIVEGCRMWLDEGLKPIPKSITESTERYRRDMNPVQEFADECCEFGAEYRVTVRQMKQVYMKWCTENKMTSISPREFNERMEGFGVKRDLVYTECRGRKTNVQHWLGVRLADVWDDEF